MTKKLAHKFGTDPEAFVYQEMIETDYGNIPVIIPPAALIEDFGFESEIIDRKKVLFSGDGFQWSEDGAAIEMQISPKKSVNTFNAQVNGGISQLKKFLKEKDMKLWTKPLGYFDLKKYWENRGDDFQLCVMFGCDPDQWPYIYVDKGLENTNQAEEIDASKHTLRYGGAHVHIQAPKSKPLIYFPMWENVAVVFDFFAGMLNTSFTRNNNLIMAEKARLEFYGKPGRIRLQEYNADKKEFGIEYRVMSNHWLGNPLYTNKLLYALDLAITIAESELLSQFIVEHDEIIVDMYNAAVNFDQKSAKDIFCHVMGWSLKNGFILSSDLNTFIPRSRSKW
jgi:hypothetical protein